jgi:parallel beta-helix repeat protein
MNSKAASPLTVSCRPRTCFPAGSNCFSICLAILAALAAPRLGAAEPPASGAAVDETVDVVLHVNQRHEQAADQNAGSEEAPLRTVQAAAHRAYANRREGRGTKISVHPGIYRESIEVGSFVVEPDAPPIIFEGTEAGAVVIRGSDVFTDWQREAETNLVRHRWPHRWGQAEIPWAAVADHLKDNPVVLRAEMVLIDGQLLRQVMTLEDLRRQPGAFFVQEAEENESAGTIWAHPPDGTDLARAKVEAAVRPTLFTSHQTANLVLRNLVFEHASTRIGWPAVRFNGGRNILVEDCRIEWNNWNALSAYVAADVTWRRVATNHNGAGGMNGWRVTNLRVEDSQASYNNWRGAWGDFLGWAQGQKFLSLRGAYFRNYRATGNQATGLWFDYDNQDVLVDGANVSDNTTRGFFLEASQGPLTIRNSQVSNNGQDGIFITNVAHLTLENNRIVDNVRHQIHCPWLADEHIERPVRNHQTGEMMGVRTTDWTLRGNTISGRGEGLLIAVAGWEHFLQNFQAEENLYHHTDRDDAFGIFRQHGFEYQRLDLDGWREQTGQDQNASFSRQAP